MKHEDGTFTEPYWGNEDGVITAYMEKLVFDYELGGDAMGSKVYPNPECVYMHKGDGLVAVEIRLKEVVEEIKPKEQGRHPAKEIKAAVAKRDLDPDWIEYQRLRLKFDKEFVFHMKRKLTAQIERLNTEKENACANQDFNKAARCRDMADELRSKLKDME